MPISNKFILACGCLGAVILATAACSPKRIPPMTVADLMEDRVTLDGVLMKCNQNPGTARTDSDCLNARIATCPPVVTLVGGHIVVYHCGCVAIWTPRHADAWV